MKAGAEIYVKETGGLRIWNSDLPQSGQVRIPRSALSRLLSSALPVRSFDMNICPLDLLVDDAFDRLQKFLLRICKVDGSFVRQKLHRNASMSLFAVSRIIVFLVSDPNSVRM